MTRYGRSLITDSTRATYAAGRPTHTILAKKMAQGPDSELLPLRREMRYRCWYTIAFDENDLFDPPPPPRQRNGWTLH